MQTITHNPNDQQRTEAWHADRLGKFSASQFHRLMTEPKLKADKEAGNLSQGAITYVLECAAERLTGKRAKEEFTSRFTEHGVLFEPVAKGIYNAVFDADIIDTEYIPLDEYCGGSPDGLVGDDGLIEIKCPYTITSHIEHQLMNDLKTTCPEYYWQCVGYLLITGRKWIDFVSYHPEYPGRLQLVRKRLFASGVLEDTDRLKNKLEKAKQHLKTILNKLA